MTDRIYIQGSPDNETATWCRDRIEDDDHEYIAIEEYNEAIKEIAAWREHGKRIGVSAGIIGHTGKWQVFETDAELGRLGHPAYFNKDD